MKIYLIPVMLLCLVACGQKKTDKLIPKHKNIIKYTGNTAMRRLTYKGKFGPDTVKNFYPDDSVFNVNILTGGQFHFGTGISHPASHKWIGIFHNTAGYYLAPTTISTSRFEALNDDPGQKTGTSVFVDNKDDCDLLITGLSGLIQGKIDTIATNFNLMPGEKLNFSYKGVNYSMYAFGSKSRGSMDAKRYKLLKKDGGLRRSFELSNYRLYLSATVNGKTTEQLLVAAPNMAPFEWQVILIADIDRDSIPDIIMNTSADYALSTLSLYLSGGAGNGKLLKLMAQLDIPGC